ncbi:DUF4192 family protein [Agromyces mariniharenae]|nr:DUF4192 family protein [Agromyces mariniharenae]
MTTIIRAAAAHDLLALVPALAGFAPERSIVCVAFRGSRSAGLLRHDLPRRARDRPSLVSAIVGTLCRMPGVDAVVPIAYTDRTFEGSRGLPERALLALLVRRAEQAGFDVRDALCRAADGWGSLLDPATPAGGHALAMIDESPAAAALPEREPVHASSTASGRLPERDVDLSAAIAAELAAFDALEGIGAQLDRLGDLADPVALVEALLDEPPAGAASESPTALRLAWFLHLAERPPVRDAMMLQFAFGPVVGAAAHDDAVETAERAERTGETVDELVRRELTDGAEGEVSELLGRLLLGRSTVRPDPGRVERALEVSRIAAANAPGDLHVAPLCIAAWLAWSLGRGSAAGALIDLAVEASPGHSMATLLSAFIGSGALPEWAFVDPRSSSRRRP